MFLEPRQTMQSRNLGTLGDRAPGGSRSSGAGERPLRFREKVKEQMVARTGGMFLPKASYDITDTDMSLEEIEKKRRASLWTLDRQRFIPGFNAPQYVRDRRVKEFATGPQGEIILETDLFGASIAHDKFGTPIHKGVGTKDIMMIHKKAISLDAASFMEQEMKPLGREVLNVINQINWRIDEINRLGMAVSKPDTREIVENVYVLLNKSVASYVFPPAGLFFKVGDRLLQEFDIPLSTFDIAILSNPLTAWTWPIITFGFPSKKKKRLKRIKALISELRLLEHHLDAAIKNLNSLKTQYDRLVRAVEKGPEAIKVKMDVSKAIPTKTVEVIEDIAPGFQRIKRVERAITPASIGRRDTQLMYFAGQESPVLATYKKTSEYAKTKEGQEEIAAGVLAPPKAAAPVVKQRVIYGGLLDAFPKSGWERAFHPSALLFG